MAGIDEELMAKLRRNGVVPASQLPIRSCNRLLSWIPAVDEVLGGGLTFGQVVEWGMPFRTGGRQVMLHYLRSATRSLGLPGPLLCLWVSLAESQVAIYPPYLDAHGIDLGRVHFASVDRTVDQLKHFFLNPLFRLIILDDPGKLSRSDMAFLARRVEYNAQILMVLRNFYLTNRFGNVWAKLRINCHQHPAPPYPFRIDVLRGPHAESRTFDIGERWD